MASLNTNETPPSQENKSVDFIPRAYQLELYEHAKRQNSILVLGTGSGKTFISILLIKDLGHQIRSQNEERKWTVFVVNTVPLVYQQCRAIQQHTPFNVGCYERSVGVDFWKEKDWKEQLEKHEVLVIIGQIFYDILLHNYLSLKQVNLLILDECHHATGNHPMREIMRQLNDLRERKPDCCPRVVGLTACVIHKKCKHEDVTKKLRELETTMCCTLVTPDDAQAAKQYSTAPKEKVVSFALSDSSEYAERISAQLFGIESEINEMKDIEEKHKKILKRKLKNISEIMHHLGDWCGAQAVKYEIENFEDAEECEEIPALRDVKKLLHQRLGLIYNYCLEEEGKISNSWNHITKKVQRLLDILHNCREKDICGLLFVERRNTAKLLCEFLKELALRNEAFSFIKPMFVVSANKSPADINLIRSELIRQKETLEKFARGEINFLISTSVLEEGVDVRKCNIVIRFDKPMNFRSYVQSRGRARAIPSRYVLMVGEDELNDFLSSIALYREIEKQLTKLCHNRQLPTDQETRAHFAEDEYIAPYKPYGPDGPSVTFSSAIPLINVYCGKLPHDKFTELVPDIIYETSEGEIKQMVKAGIKLPINSCLRSYVYGDWIETKDHAKKSAAMVLCKKLHEMKELNDNLCPVEKLDDSILEDLVEVQPEESTEDGQAEPGTKKRRQVYSREMCPAFSSMSNGFKLYSVLVQSNAFTSSEIAIDSEIKNTSIGLLCKQTLRPPPFTLYSPKWNEVVVRIQLIDEHVQLDSDKLNNIEHFHKIVFENLLGISPSLFCYFPHQTSLLILPMKSGTIDDSLLQHTRLCDSLRTYNEITSFVDIFNFERSVFEDAIIYPLYAMSEELFYVTKIEDHMNPQDQFPESEGRGCITYENYFFSKYDRKITKKDQPLISAKHLPKDLNFLKKLNHAETKKRPGREPPKFVPELCGVLPLKASLWWQIMLLPSVFHRLNSLSLAEELSKKMSFPYSCVIPNWQCNEYDSLDFNWSEKLIKKIVESHGSNLSVSLANVEPKPIQPFMLLNALTLRGANDNFDVERLEVLGDSFLKFIVAEYLFLNFSDDHEGKLSQRRSMLVSNRTLYSLGKEKKIPEKIQGKVLNPAWSAVPGFVLKTEMEQKLRGMQAPYDMWARFGKTTEEEFREGMKVIQHDTGRTPCYNPWTEQELPDKSVADSVEALIGVHLLVGGSKAAINFLSNLGIGISKGTSLLDKQLPIKSAVLSNKTEADVEVQRYYNKCCLDKLEKKINYSFRDRSFLVQAVTHSSFIHNSVTDCYQRLEFLGDAVLDYLVTGMVFSSHTSYNPGQMSDLRSYYVKNETLAKVTAKHKLQQHLLYLAPMLQSSIERYLGFFESGLNSEEELMTEDETMDAQDVEVPKVLGDLVEAIIGAVYLDSGRSLQKSWDVVQVLMGDIIQQTLTAIPINCVRKLFEKVPGAVKFVKLAMEEGSTMSRCEVQVQGLPSLIGCGKNYKVAKVAAAKAALRKLKEKEKSPMSGGI